MTRSPASRNHCHTRIQPRVWIGLAVAVGYIVLVVALRLASGIDYDDWGGSGHNLFWGAGVSLIIAAAALAGITTWLGWWQPALRDRERSRVRWPIIAPAAMVVLAGLTLLGTDWGAYSFGFFAASLVLLLVGFTEELTYRGLLVVALRSRMREVWVWLLSSVIFGAVHLVNTVLGQPLGDSIVQADFALGVYVWVLPLALVGGLVLALKTPRDTA